MFMLCYVETSQNLLHQVTLATCVCGRTNGVNCILNMCVCVYVCVCVRLSVQHAETLSKRLVSMQIR